MSVLAPLGANLCFFVGLSCLLVHEMDAIRAHEWRLFLGLQRLRDEVAFQVFTALHVPLYLLVFVALFPSERTGINEPFVLALDLFFLVHLLLHIGFRTHPQYRFQSRFSWAVIVACAAAGLVDIILRMRS